MGQRHPGRVRRWRRTMGFPADQNAAVAEIEYRGKKIEGPVWVQAGHPDDTVTVFLGYGRDRAGATGDGHGYNAYEFGFPMNRISAAA